jgi:predicted RNA binding protein YcfA (HicA-like mRNA interferase family)
MSKRNKIITKVLSGTSDANINFNELRQLLKNLGFDERIRSSHHIFTKDEVEEILNLQPKGADAKPYQVKQIRNVIVKYKLAGEEDD